MITKFSLKNFKCFSGKQNFVFSRLNLLTGYNGRGKSSVFQALLMLSQSIDRYNDIKKLCINGNFVKLDLYEDIVNSVNFPIEFSLFTDSGILNELTLGYKKDKENSRSASLCELIMNGNDSSANTRAYINASVPNETGVKDFRYSNDDLSAIKSILNNFYYISADRLGPTKYEEKSELEFLNPVGKNGQFRLNVLYKDKNLLESVSKDLQWIMDFSDDVRITGEENNFPVLGLTFVNTTRSVKSINTGFGYSYILSILLLLRYVNKGVIFIENPEAHLHPLAQSRLMQLVCKTAIEHDNLQIFIETHSEHIINAVRLCSVSGEINFKNTDASIYFFDKDFSVKSLEINKKGQILHWPAGFFDQQSIDLAKIIKLGIGQ